MRAILRRRKVLRGVVTIQAHDPEAAFAFKGDIVTGVAGGGGAVNFRKEIRREIMGCVAQHGGGHKLTFDV
jgi:hypothetical protein